MMGYGYGASSCPWTSGGGAGHAGLGLMAVFWLLVIVGIVVLIVWALRRPAHPHHAAAPPVPAGRSRAADIARERYARGEIGREEFLRLTDDLK